MPFQSDPNIIAGMERAEDAGVYKISDDLALVQTVDFFTPIVDDPYDFGRIAVTNALSDVYAMGGRPLTALNIVCFPRETMDISILRDILRGGLDQMHEAGVILLGGHTVDDPELKYGLAVTGTIRPDKVVHNTGAKPGDRLILTKPLGTGIISTAIKHGAASKKAIARIVKSMTTLNRAASEAMLEVGVNACKDITGFGLLGHAAEMIQGTGVGMVINAAAVPCFPEAKEYAAKGFVPGAVERNRDYRKEIVDIGKKVPRYMQNIIFDPQTSGGLLIAVPARRAPRLLKTLHEKGVAEAVIIGEVVAEPAGRIRVG
ncbi:MAG: selenide, water dikinase SelD [Chloroflexi bacterium RBG_16_56_11]|nr:MAG: selenide, water dikinase SelD [Chloroflexi bacterium RBG_16_56_11]